VYVSCLGASVARRCSTRSVLAQIAGTFAKPPFSLCPFQLAQARILWRGYTSRPHFLSSARARLRNCETSPGVSFPPENLPRGGALCFFLRFPLSAASSKEGDEEGEGGGMSFLLLVHFPLAAASSERAPRRHAMSLGFWFTRRCCTRTKTKPLRSDHRRPGPGRFFSVSALPWRASVPLRAFSVFPGLFP
jgi:hypothetical protein